MKQPYREAMKALEAMKAAEMEAPGGRRSAPGAESPVDSETAGAKAHDVRRLRAAGSLNNFELYLLTLVEGLEALHLDGREVNEDVAAAVLPLNEPVPLLGVEPFDPTLHYPHSS